MFNCKVEGSYQFIWVYRSVMLRSLRVSSTLYVMKRLRDWELAVRLPVFRWQIHPNQQLDSVRSMFSVPIYTMGIYMLYEGNYQQLD